MAKPKLLITLLLAAFVSLGAQAQHQFDIKANKMGAKIQPTMYGIFFEDINFGADGGLYAEMIENRSFEFPQSLMGWQTFGNVAINTASPAFERNPHYATLSAAGHPHKHTGLENRGFFGMGFKKDMKYELSVWARLSNGQGDSTGLYIDVLGNDKVIGSGNISVQGKQWAKYTCTITAKETAQKGFIRIFLSGKDAIDVDHISMMPADNWHGLRADLVKDLEDLKPGIFRFPGGCIVEGTTLETRYQWKNSVGAVENRPLNENRWLHTIGDRVFPNYYQSYGMGFYEFFLLSEKIGAEPLPVLSVGIACQFQNDDKDSKAHVALDDLQPYIDDALDLIEFANGSTDTKWGKLRAEMGHPEPFNLKQIGIGNEQWGPLYPERLAKFIEQIRAKYPDIKICGSSGPSADGENFDYGWQEMRKLKVDLVDEHYYMPPKWFLDNANRYDKYSRKGPKVFAGEYAAHGEGRHNNWEAALAEACFMTGLERNADVVWQCTYAPLFSHVEGWQWRPDLIWFDNLETVRSANWYVQMLYSTNKGTNVLSLTEDGKAVAGNNGLYASAAYDSTTKTYIVKVGNAGESAQDVTLNFKGIKGLKSGEAITLQASSMDAENTIDNKDAITPKTSTIQATGKTVTVSVPAKAFVVYRFQ